MSLTTSMTTFDVSVELNRSVEKQLAASMTAFTTRTVEFLASEYGFDAQEAIQRLGLDSVSVSRPMKKKASPKAPKVPKEKRLVPSIPLPFCGVQKEDWCCGLRLNHGLYSQCTMPKCNDTDFCKTCTKQVEKNETEKPTYGTIQERMAIAPMEFRDPKGKAVVCYGNVMAKLKISKETAIAEAAKFDLVISEEQFEERKTTRGRPKKDATATDTDSESGDTKKSGGRPKKNKKVIAAKATDDLIASLVAKADLDGSESDSSLKSDVSDQSEVSVQSAVSTDSKKANKVKVLKPVLTDEEKAAKKAATAAKRKATLAAKPELTDEEKAAKKAASSAKRTATWAAKKAAKEAADTKPAAVLGVTVTDVPVVPVVAPVAAPVVAPVAAPVVAPVAAPVVAPVVELVEEVVSDDDSDGEMEVTKFEHDGVTYLKADDDVLYDSVSQDEVGVWNSVTKQVDFNDTNCEE